MAKRDRKRQPALNDWHLWSEVTRSVSPLKRATQTQSVDPEPQSKPEKPQKQPKSTNKPPTWSPSATPFNHQPQRFGTGNTSSRTMPGRVIEPRMRRRLMRGQLPIDATIDLHGLRQSEAHAALSRFITARYARGDRTILVITGKGLKKTGYGSIEQTGVLRTMLPIWLTEPALSPMVAGWETSAQAHGGEGAYYVRLKRADR